MHVSDEEFARDEPVLVTVYNNHPYAIHLQGCNSYMLERREGGEWVERHLVRCVREGEAVLIKPLGKLEFEIPARSGTGLEGTYRVKVPYWYACENVRSPAPVSEMDCAGEGNVYSKVFVVTSD